VVRRDDDDARQRRRQPGDEPLPARDERGVRHHHHDVVGALDHAVGGAVEELGRPARVVVGQSGRFLEGEPPGDVRRGRQFVDRVLGRTRGKGPEPVVVGTGGTGDEEPDVDLQTGRTLALGRGQLGVLTSVRSGATHETHASPRPYLVGVGDRAETMPPAR
jgi:hypothetical protein